MKATTRASSDITPREPGEPDRIGPYLIEETLGAGGMGIVYRARHESTGSVVALKSMRLVNRALCAALRREIHAMRRIEHPAVVRIVDEGLWEGLPWFAMELLEGITLRLHTSRLKNGSSPVLSTLLA